MLTGFWCLQEWLLSCAGGFSSEDRWWNTAWVCHSTCCVSLCHCMCRGKGSSSLCGMRDTQATPCSSCCRKPCATVGLSALYCWRRERQIMTVSVAHFGIGCRNVNIDAAVDVWPWYSLGSAVVWGCSRLFLRPGFSFQMLDEL